MTRRFPHLLLIASGAVALAASAAAAPVAPPAWADPRLATAYDARGAARPSPSMLAGRAGAVLTAPSPEAPEVVARAFAASRLKVAGDLAHVSTVTAGGGVRFVTFEQRFAGLPVLLGRVTVAVAQDGSVLAAHAGEIALAPPSPPEGRPLVTTPAAALAAAQRALGREPGSPAGPRPAADLVVLPTATGGVRAWRVQLADGGQPDRLVQVVVAESDGRPLQLMSLMFPGIAGGWVVPRDPTFGRTYADFVDPAWHPSVDSPLGWSDALETSGNNTFVQLDREADFWPPYGRMATATGDPPVLDFPFTGVPADDADLALTNVFWAINDAHDRFRRLGFDEASGACQAANHGRGGAAGDDRIWALVQYASGDGTTPYNGVGLGIGADGSFTYLVAGVFEDASGALKDSALETDLLYHELAHQLSTRLAGNDAGCLSGAQPQALSEGWSDFIAASFTDDPIIAAWSSGRPGGVRTGPIGATGVSYVNLCEGGNCNRFNDGEIWAGMLWDVRARLIQLHGRAAGIEMAERLAVEGMRYTPCRATFLQARDAILLADAALSGGAHRCELWQLFVNRGMGFSATSSGPDDQRPMAAYDLPPECSGGVAVRLDRTSYAPDDDGALEVVDAAFAPGATVALATSGGDALEVPLVAVPGGPLARGAFRIVPGPPDPADGVLQAQAGETVTATYRTATDAARVSDAMSVVLTSHRIYGTWCQMDADDDTVDGWSLLPGFLDPGETATVVANLGNAMADDLEDLEITVTSLSPSVRTLPVAPIALGTVAAQRGPAPRPFSVVFKATGALTATPGETADIRLDLRSRGRSGSVVLRIEMAMDYVVETGLSPFAGGTETFDPATSSTLGAWTTSALRGTVNWWGREDCAGNLTPGGWRVGQPGCAEYADGQVATTLVSPPLFTPPADAVAYRLQDWSFSVDSDLYTDPGNPFCEADFVGLFVTDDPASFDASRPEVIYAGQAQRYWRPIYEDTGGWVTQGPYYYSRDPQFFQPGVDYAALRLQWVFWGDVYDCGFELANHGRFALDDVRFTYDIVRKVPEPQPCTATCAIRVPLEIDPPGPKCAGTTFTMRATGWEQSGCTGTVWFGFGGPGVPPEANWTTVPETTAVAEDGGYYWLYSQCDTDGLCDDYSFALNGSPAPPARGTIMPGTLRLRREDADVVFSWVGAAAPPSYGVWLATTRAELASGDLAQWALVGRADGAEGPRGENEWRGAAASLGPAMSFYRVTGRHRCTDAPNP